MQLVDAESAICGLNPVISPFGVLVPHLQNGDQATLADKGLDDF